MGKRLLVVSLLLGAGLLAAAGAEKSASGKAAKAGVVESYGRLPLSFEENVGQTGAQVKFFSRGPGYGLYLTGQEAVLQLQRPQVGGGVTGRLAGQAQGLGGTRRPRLSPNGVAPLLNHPSLPTRPGALLEREDAAADLPTPDVLRMQMVGMSAGVRPVGEEKLPGTVNYFLGSDAARWHGGIATYGRVRYGQVYPGVDLVYYGNQRQLEYDFVVAPGADAGAIRVRFAGAKGLRLEADGGLAIAAEHGTVMFRKPVVYQVVDGERRAVAGQFALGADQSVGFVLGRYDRGRELVIDPILAYSTFFGGSTADFVTAVASDAGGNVYVTGLTSSSDFPLTAGAFQDVNFATPSNQVSTAFVSKLNASGTALLYSTYVGGVGVPETLHNQGDYGKSIAVDGSGNAYVAGYTYSSNFPVTSGAFQQKNKAAAQQLATGFAFKLNASGTGLLYSTYLGGSVIDQLTAIALDGSGNAYVAGVSGSSDYPVTSGAFQTTNRSYAANGYNEVVTKLNATGSALVYSTYLGGTDDNASGDGSIYWTNPIVVDKSGDAYVCGFTTASNFPVTTGALQTTNKSVYSVTVTKLNPTGTGLLYSTYLGGSSNGGYGSICEGLAVDGAGSAYVAGYTSDTNFPVTTGAFQTTNKGLASSQYATDTNQNGFVTKLNATGTALVYSTYLGGTTGPWGGDQIYDLALDTAGDVYVTGSAMSSDFPVTSNAYQSTNKGATHCCDYTTYTSNTFLTEFNSTGTGLVYSTYLGGSGTQNPNGAGGFGDTAYAIALGGNGNVYTAGFTTSPTFPVTAGAFNTSYKTQQNPGFIANFVLGAAPTTKETETTLVPSANSVVPGTSVTFTATVAAVSGTVVPTGNVVFSVDLVNVATVALNGSGKATYTASLPAGAHYILASYGGSATFEASGDGFTEYITPISPVLTPAGGTYFAVQTVSITDATAGSVLYYTLDGSAPSRFTSPYTAPLTVGVSKTVKTVAVATNDANSVVVTGNYTIIGSPWVLSEPVASVATPNATLRALVNPLGVAGTYFFQYGTSAAALNLSTAKTALAAGNAQVTVTAPVAGLASKTTYYYRVVVTTAGGTTYGSVVGFVTN